GVVVSGLPGAVLETSPVAPPVVELARVAGWSPLPLSVRDARRMAGSLRAELASLAGLASLADAPSRQAADLERLVPLGAGYNQAQETEPAARRRADAPVPDKSADAPVPDQRADAPLPDKSADAPL